MLIYPHFYNVDITEMNWPKEDTEVDKSDEEIQLPLKHGLNGRDPTYIQVLFRHFIKKSLS